MDGFSAEESEQSLDEGIFFLDDIERLLDIEFFLEEG